MSSTDRRRIVFLGLTITSSWGNGHAVTYRGLLRALAARGHEVLFLERDVPWYARHRDLAPASSEPVGLYGSVADLQARFGEAIRAADTVVLGSYVPDGVAVGEWLLDTATGTRVFYDIDTPATLAALDAETPTYISRKLIPRFDLYLSFTGGPALRRLESDFGARRARAFHCTADPADYHPEPRPAVWDLGYMGTYSPDRQPMLEQLLLEPARQRPSMRCVVAGPSYPNGISWPPNVQRIEHLPPSEHRAFYGAQRYTLNLTRAAMVEAGHAPSVRLFEAAACGTPILTDAWPGLDEFFVPEQEIAVVADTADVLRRLADDDGTRRAMARRARRRILREHTPDHRARQLEHELEVLSGRVAEAS
jgi:spore maturation protein CgeB